MKVSWVYPRFEFPGSTRAGSWQMKLELVIQSEVSQKEKNKCHILTHIYGIWNNSSGELIYREEMEMQT